MTDCVPASNPMIAGVKFVKSGVYDGPMSQAVSVPYREAIGCLMYLQCSSRPDIACAVEVLSRFCNEPKLAHWQAIKQVLRYLKGTQDLAMVYGGGPLQAFSNADYAGCCDTRKSVNGLLVQHYGGPIIWKASKQSRVATSTTHAEFVACSEVSKEVVWIRSLTKEMSIGSDNPTTIFVDNKGVEFAVKNNQVRSKLKQLDIELMAIRERVQHKEVSVHYVNTSENTADIMTKPLAPKRFQYLRSMLAMAILLMAMSCTPTGAWKWRLGEFSNVNGESALQSLTLQVTNPCEAVERAEEYLRGTSTLSPKAKMNATWIEHTKLLCKGTFDDRVKTAFNSIDGCSVGARHKRDTLSAATAVSTIASIIVGVTNLIRGAGSEVSSISKRDAMNQLTEQVKNSVKQTLIDKSIMAIETERELEVISAVTPQHLDITRDEAQQMPMLMWATYHVVHELYAGSANLRAIKKYCSSGRLATQEIAEMLELKRLSKTDPEETFLESISIDPEKIALEFTYRLEDHIEFSVKEFAVVIGAVALVVFLSGLFLVNLELVKSVRTHRNAAAKVASRSNSFSSTNLRRQVSVMEIE